MRRRKRKTDRGTADSANKEAQRRPAGPLGTNLGKLLKAADEHKKREQIPTHGPGEPRSIPVTQPPPDPPTPERVKEPPRTPPPQGPRNLAELRMLNDAYEGAVPLSRATRTRARTDVVDSPEQTARRPFSGPARRAAHRAEDERARRRLDALVGEGVHFAVDTHAEGWVAARRQGVGPRELRRLRTPSFSAEATLDLHGATRAEVARMVTRFVRQERDRGCRFILLIHGKGLHAEDGRGVLGQAVFETLTRGGAAPLVRALSTPDTRHGGRGATAVELV